MKILLLGADGQVGWELRDLLSSLGEVTSAGRAQLDLADLAGLRRAVAAVAPDVIVNAAAYNAVDKAESEPDAALRVNAEAVAVLGEESEKHKAALVHYSTDFVFDGSKGTPYTEADTPRPLSAYGRSKLAGETALLEMDAPALVLRTAWVYSIRRKSFVSVMLDLARQRTELRVVTDQVGSPTYCRDLASATASLVQKLLADPYEISRQARGVYHAAGGGHCSRFELAQAAIALDPRRSEHKVERILPAPAAEFPAPAQRPSSAPLNCDKLAARFGVRLRPWREALSEALLRERPPL